MAKAVRKGKAVEEAKKALEVQLAVSAAAAAAASAANPETSEALLGTNTSVVVFKGV
jgi:hypothetical protein